MKEETSQKQDMEIRPEIDVPEDNFDATVEASEGFAAPAMKREDVDAARPAIKRGRFLPNLISNVALFGFNIFIGLWYTPYLVHHLGTAAFGIIPLVTQITGYMIVLTATLNSATGRFITIALERNDDEEANRYFNASFFGGMIMVILLIPLAMFATVYIDKLIIVPDGQLTQTRLLFVCTAAGFLLGTLQSPFGVSRFCRNRFDLGNAISFVQAVVRVGLVVVFFSVLTPQIWQVGLASLVAMFFGWGWSIRLWRRLTPTLKISLSHFSRAALKDLISMGGFVSISTIAAILYAGIDLLLANRMLGPETAGEYAAISQWSVLIRSMSGIIVGLFCPTIFSLYARQDIDGLICYGRKAVKLIGLTMALPIGLVCGFSAPLLRTWLGPNYVNLDWLMSLMTIHLSVNIAVTPLFNIQMATDRVRWHAFVTIILGLCSVAVAVYLTSQMGWGLYGIAAAGTATLTAKKWIFTPLYTAHILHRRFDTFLREMLPLIAATLGTAAVGKMVALTWDVSGWFHLAFVAAALSIGYVAIGYWLLLTSEERKLAWSMMPIKKWGISSKSPSAGPNQD